jgi:HD-like signal output (HDOD) protein
MSGVADAVREEVTIAISKDQLQLPTLPEVALKIRDAAEREDISAADLAEVIGEDPSLAARVLKVANSPIPRRPRNRDDRDSDESARHRLHLQLATASRCSRCSRPPPTS